MIPGTNPVAGFPPRSGATAAAIAKPKPPWPGHVGIKTTINSRVLLEDTALEAAGTASKVVSPTVAVPVTRPNIWPTETTTEGWHATPTSEIGTEVTTRAGLATSLAHVTPAEVEMLARPTVPVSRLPVHFLDLSLFCPCILITSIVKKM